MKAQIHLALTAVQILFSLNYIISKLGMASFHPLAFAYVRVAGAAILLAVLLPRGGGPLERGDGWRIAGLASLGVVINQALFLAGLALTSAHIAAVLITTIPVFTLAAAMALGRERATASKIGGIALAAVGALLVVGREGFTGNRSSLLGTLMLIGNCIAYALYLVLSKPVVSRIGSRPLLARLFGVSTLLMLPIAAVPMARQEWSAIPPRAWLALALVIAGPTIGAYLLSAWALSHADSSLVAAYTYVQPVLTAALAALFLGEQIGAMVIVAALLIFAGVSLAGRPAPPAAREEAVPGNPD